MKKIILSLFSSLLWLSSFSQWNTQSSITANSLTSVYFTSANIGFASSSGGDIYKTTDGGVSWTSQYTAGYSLYGIYFSDANNGFATGSGGSFFKSTDAGATWVQQTTGQGFALSSAYFIDKDTGYVAGNSGTILKSTNGGITWTAKTSNTLNDLYSVYFTDATTGYAVGLSGTIVKTTDYGNTWINQTSGAGNLFSVYFVSPTYGYAVGAGGTLVYTNDGGTNWYSTYSATTNTLYSIRFSDAYHGFAAGANGTIIRTNDGGNMWYAQTSGTSNDLNAVFFTDANNGVAVGTVGTVQTTNDGGCANPTVTVSGVNTICYGNSTILTAAGATDYKWDANGGNAITYTTTISPPSTTGVSVVGTSSDGCLDTAFYNVAVNPLPNVTIGGTNTICSGSSTALTASGAATYNWTPASGLSSTTTSNTNASPASTTIYSVTGTDANGCANTDSIAIIVNILPNITVTGTNTLCSGNSTSLSASGAVTYNWVPSVGLSCGTCANTTANPGTTTVYTVSGTDINGCINSVSENIAVFATPGITTTPNDITCNGLCNGSTSAIPSGGSPPYTYLWSTSATTAGITNLCPGNYTVTVTDANGCSSTVWGPIIEPTALNASIGTYTNALCLGVNNGIANDNSSGGTAPYTYLWMPSGETTSTATNLAAGTVSLTVTDAQGCSNASAFFLSATNTSTLTISAPANLCQGQTGQLTYSITGATAPYMNDWFDYVTWSSFCMADTSSLTPLIPFCGQDTIKLTVTDNFGCIAIAYKYIAVGYADSLSGIISDTSLNPVMSGEVYLFQQKTNHVGLYDTLGITGINTNGTYSFPNVPYGDYFLKVVADTSILYYPTSVGTYYSNKPNAYQWDSALVINHYTCNASNVGGYTVTIIEIPVASGPGTISGYVTQGPGYGQRLGSGHNSVMGAPLKGVDIKLGKNPGGGAAARTTSDTSAANAGFYSFTNVPVGSYKIYVDIPNYGMDSVLNITISATNSVSTQNNYYVDSVMIRVDSVQYVGVSQITHLPTQISVYPNPAHGNMTLTSSEDLGLVTIHNSLGEMIFKEKINSSQYLIDLGKQPAGIYILHAQGAYIRIIKE